MNFCEFTAFDLDKNMQVTETEIDRLIQVTGLMELDGIFENLDINKGILSFNALCKEQQPFMVVTIVYQLFDLFVFLF